MANNITNVKTFAANDVATLQAAMIAFIAATANIIVVDVQVNGVQTGIQGSLFGAINYYIDAMGTNPITQVEIITATTAADLQTSVQAFITGLALPTTVDVIYNGVTNGIQGILLAAILYK